MPLRTVSRPIIPVQRCNTRSSVESLAECKKVLLLAKAGRMNGCLIEGMACPGGCVAGAGTNIPIPQAAKALAQFKDAAQEKVPKEPEE